MGQQLYGERTETTQRYWNVERLWRLSESLPTESVPIDSIVGVDDVTWFGPDGPHPTCREIAQHCRRINNADLSYPILLTADRRVFDGMHRIARCIMEGSDTIQAKRFLVNPEPDETIELTK